VVLLFGAGLLGRSLRNLRTVDLGFEPSHLAMLSLAPGSSGYKTPQSAALADTLIERAARMPGVTSAAAASIGVLSGDMFAAAVRVAGHEKHEEPNHYINGVTPGYFRTLRIPLLAGRDFTPQDNPTAPKVAIVNRNLADHYWPGQDPIGRKFKWGGGVEVVVVGLVGNAKYDSVHEAAPRTIFLPFAQGAAGRFTVYVRAGTAASSPAALALLRDEVRAADPKLPVLKLLTLEDQRDLVLSRERLLSFLSALFSGLALLLCATGLYGLVAQWVASRTPEIGVRIAVGASPGLVLRLFLREALLLAAVGVALGVPAALVAARSLKAMLFGLPPSDPLTLAASCAVLLAVTALAAWLPARRATAVDPMSALRVE
jgi:predicted permease